MGYDPTPWDIPDDVQAEETAMTQKEALAIMAASSPETADLLKAIFDHNAKEDAWREETLAEMAEASRLEAIEERGSHVIGRFTELLYAMFRHRPQMQYREEELPYGTRKVLEIVWLNNHLDDIIYPSAPYGRD